MKQPRRIIAGTLALALAAGCAIVPSQASAPLANPPSTQDAVPNGPKTFVFHGDLEQGGWIRGHVPAGTVSARLGDTPITYDAQGEFFAGFDRNADPETKLVATLADGRKVQTALAIKPRHWHLEHLDIPLIAHGTTAEFMKRRRPELAQIVAARAVKDKSDGWDQKFIWPLIGRITDPFGSQRIYRGGVKGAYHSGIDISNGRIGDPVVAPADGVVTLATKKPFSLEGNFVIIDHGQGLNSALLHLSKIDVHVGERVKRGQLIGLVGDTGRATGPHLHWSLMWKGARIDPRLLVGPMPRHG